MPNHVGSKDVATDSSPTTEAPEPASTPEALESTPPPEALAAPAARVATRSTARRRGTNQAVLQAGKPKTPASFINIEGPEGTIAAYCGCNDIGVFRRFYMGPLVMPYYLKSLKYAKAQRRNVLSLLEDVPYDQYWETDEDPEEVYPPTDNDPKQQQSNINYGLGLILWQMLRQIRKGILSDMPTVDERAFTELTKCKLPTKSTEVLADEAPNFGPFPGECDIEPLNRCICLFAHIKYTTNKSQWDKRFFGKSQWDAHVSISVEYQPDWMRAANSVDVVEAPDEFAGPPAEKSLDVTVCWKHDSKHKSNTAYVSELKEMDVFTQIPKSVVVTITPSMLGPEVRDRIRESFKLHEFEGQLEQLTLHEGENDFPALDADWKEILDVLFEHPSATFSCLFRACDSGESPWEYGGPPAVLRDFLETKKDDVVSKQKTTPEHVEQVQQKIFQMTVPKLETSFDPLKLFGNDKERLKKAYSGIDVSTPKGRQEWQMEFLPKLAGKQKVRYDEDDKLKPLRKLSREQQAALKAARADGAMQAVDLEQAHDDEAGQEQDVRVARARYYAYQTAMGGTSTSVGPPIEPSACALQMRRTDENGEEVYEYTKYPKNLVKRRSKPYQVNGTAWALASFHGEIPTEQTASTEVKAAVKQLRRPRVPALMILDQTGLGKTIMALQIALACSEQPCAYMSISGKAVYKPIFLTCPQNLIRQWAREIIFKWPIFDLIISYDDGTMESYLAQHVVSSSAVRAYPSPKLWPKKYAHMLNKFDPRNARTIFLTTPETNAERSLIKEEVKHPAVSFDPPQFDKHDVEIYKHIAWTETKYRSRFENVFSYVLIDEATKIKTPGSIRHTAIQLLKAKRWAFITATAMINQGTVSRTKALLAGNKLITAVHLGTHCNRLGSCNGNHQEGKPRCEGLDQGSSRLPVSLQ
jgi:hypothetical protein